ncbi:MAG TPA: hypothetical protein VK915_11295 [Gaiellaceae bacterium]|nr:hypothetical protein [Gaiellaceae bacterium]
MVGTVLGLLGMALWIAVVIAIAAGITYAVVKIFPGDDDKKPAAESPDTAS